MGILYKQIKVAFIAVVVTTAMNVFHAQAQDKKEKVPVYNYVIDDPMDVFGRAPDTVRETRYFPEFFSALPYKAKDTTYKCECYDARDSIMSMTSIKDINDVRFISLFKSYKDDKHTYTDAGGKLQPLPVSSIIRRYDRTGKNKWLSVDYATNKYTQLKEYRDDIVRSDTLMREDPIGHHEFVTINRYYRVETTK